MELVNDALRRAQVQVVANDNGDNAALIEELTTLQWTTRSHELNVGGVVRHEDRRTIAGEDHLADGFRYGFPLVRGHYNEEIPDLTHEERDREYVNRPRGEWWERTG